MEDLLPKLNALAHRTRLQIVYLLLQKSLCVRALTNRLGVSQGAVSQHLKILREAGLVRGEKRGYWTHYSVDKHALSQVANELTELASQSTVDPPACPSDKQKHCPKKGQVQS